ncbi:MAG: glutamyl-tRNA reductase [Chloroflexi bacterium]|nr:glutamyl-tRNA reductase [Chloroflexota bacterium]
MLLQLGLSHQDAPVAVRERLAVSEERLSDALQSLRGEIKEGVILSTCNRTEIYALVGHRLTGRRALDRFLGELTGMRADEFSPHLHERWQDDAIRHLFRVAAGLDSMIVGEAQILGQVRLASDAAATAGAAGPVLQRLFNRAVVVGKRARTETSISRHAVSLSYAAIEQAGRVLGTLRGTTALLVGAGKMGELAAMSLRNKGVERVLVANRTDARAQSLVQRLGGESWPFERLASALEAADLVISSTSAAHYVVTASMVEDALRERPERPLALVDIAVPRDVEPAVADLQNVHLFNIDDLRSVCESNLEQRRIEALKVEQFVEVELDRFADWLHARDVAPTIGELVNKAERIRQQELERSLVKLNGLSERDLNTVNALTTAIVNKLLHDPIVRLKQRHEQVHSRHYSHAVRELFALPPEPRVSE